jgi:hypothetical protein
VKEADAAESRSWRTAKSSREDSLRMFGVADQRRPSLARRRSVAGATDHDKAPQSVRASWRRSRERSRKLASVVSHDGDERLSR